MRQIDGIYSGIVTTADLSNQFAVLANPFLLAGEIERRLRRIVDRCFGVGDLQGIKDADDVFRTIESAADLTLGEFQRLLQDPLSRARR